MRANYYNKLERKYMVGTGKKMTMIQHGQGVGKIFRFLSTAVRRVMGSKSAKAVGNFITREAKKSATAALNIAKREGKRAAKEAAKELGGIAVESATSLLTDIGEGKNVERSIRRNVRKAGEDVKGKVKELTGKEAQIAIKRARELVDSERRRLTGEAKRAIAEQEDDMSDIFGDGLTRIGVKKGNGLNRVGSGHKKRGRPKGSKNKKK